MAALLTTRSEFSRSRNTRRPHPEGAAKRRVSKDGRRLTYRPYFTSTASQAGLSICRRAWKQRSTASSLSIISLHSRAASGRQARWSSGVPRGVRNGGSGIGGLVLPGSWSWLGVTHDVIRIASSKSERVIVFPFVSPASLKGGSWPRCGSFWRSGRRGSCEVARLRALPGYEFVFHLDIEPHQPFLGFARAGLGLRGALLERTIAFF